MDVLIIGDVFVKAEQFEDALKTWDLPIDEIVKLNWGPDTKEAFQDVVLQIEKQGPESFPVPDELLEKIEKADLLLVHFAPISSKLINAATRLKAIGTCRGGLEHVNTAVAEKNGIPVINVIRNAEAVADFTIGLLYSETRNIARSHHALKHGQWQKEYPNVTYTKSMKDQVIGIVGLGNIGRIVAQQLTRLGIEVIGNDPLVTKQELAQEGLQIPLVSLEELFQRANVVTVHLRLTDSTDKLIQKEHLERLGRYGYLINTSRAEVIDEEALLEALAAKKIAGAALDVFWQEPLPQDHPLLRLDNVTLTPHIAGDTVDALPKSPYKLIEKLKQAVELTALQH